MMGGISADGEKFLRVSRVGVWAVRVVGKKVHGFLRRGCRITPVANPTYEVADRNAGAVMKRGVVMQGNRYKTRGGEELL